MPAEAGLLIYAIIVIASAVLWHRYLPSYSGAWLFSVVTTVVLFLSVDRLQSGHWARNIEIALLLTAVPAAVVSALIGLVFRALRKADRNQPMTGS